MDGARQIFFFEEGIRAGGVGERLFAALAERGMHPDMHLTAVDDQFVQQATVASCLRRFGLDRQGMIDAVLGRAPQGKRAETEKNEESF